MSRARPGATGRSVIASTRRVAASKDPRADFVSFLRRYRRPKPPAVIRQEPFDFDPRHYKRLLALKKDRFPEPADVMAYAHDLSYAETVEPELFACLLPTCLLAWQDDLFGWHETVYGAFVEQFSAALARRPLVDDLLDPRRAGEVKAFMRHSLLDRIDRESDLARPVDGMPTYAWVHSLGSYCVFFPELEPLWRAWWRFDTPGLAVAALNYISRFMYEDDDNPIFAPWTRETGGGAPVPWETDGHIYEQSWRPENVDFFRRTVTLDYVRDALGRAALTLDGVVDSDVPAKMRDDFAYQDDLLAHRLAVFPDTVSRPLELADVDWPPPAS